MTYGKIIKLHGKCGMNKSFWNQKKVFITGHTGFKGGWLSLWLEKMGAQVFGYALKPSDQNNIYALCSKHLNLTSEIADVRDLERLTKAVKSFEPDIIFHMAAQPLVRYSYSNPVETYQINVMGTLHIFEALKNTNNCKVLINVTTDKCYENNEWVWPYREIDRLGGFDPYSNSKACSELISSMARSSFFNIDQFDTHKKSISTARAGNVIGGGDWSQDRLLPDFFRAVIDKRKIKIRSPHSTRPWQYVLDALNGYLNLAEKMYNDGERYGSGWNFGPDYTNQSISVEYILKKLLSLWDLNDDFIMFDNTDLHEAQSLTLDSAKANHQLSWHPKLNIDESIHHTSEWYKALINDSNMLDTSINLISQFEQRKI